METVIRRALSGKGSFETKLKRAAKAVDPALPGVLDIELASESRAALADWFESVRKKVEKSVARTERTWILGLDDRCRVSLSHATQRGWGKRSFLKGEVSCEWAEALLEERLPRVAYRRIWIAFLALALQSCEPPNVHWGVSVDELAQAYLGNLDEVEYWEDQ